MSIKKHISACPLDCFGVCSLVVTTEEGRVIGIEGNKENPVTRGIICRKGRKHLDRMYSPVRLKQPKLRTSEGFIDISWDEAYEIMASRLNSYIKEYGPLSIANYSGGGAGGLLKNIEKLFFSWIGGYTEFTGSLCCSAGIKAQEKDFGGVFSHSPEDIINSKTIVIWGKNPAKTHIHFMPYLRQAKANGAKVILIDPIKTETSKHSDIHLQPKPGSDVDLACAVIQYILAQNWQRDSFKAYSLNYEETLDYIRRLDIEQLADKCGVSIEHIELLARSISNESPCSFHVGYGIQRYLFGGTAVRCMDLLGAISGNIGIPGGGVNYANKGTGLNIDWDVLGAKGTVSRFIELPYMGELLHRLQNPPIKAIFISKGNPVVQQPDTSKVIESLKQIEFKIVIEHFMTETAQLADLVLPAAYFLEEEDLIYSSMWNRYVHYNERVGEPYYQTKPEYKIYTELAHKMGYTEFPIKDEKQWIEALTATLVKKGLDLKALYQKKYAHSPVYKDIPWEDHCFSTRSGKLEFIEVQELKKYFTQEDKENTKEFSFITVHKGESLNSQHFIDNTEPMPIVYIHPEDAASCGIAEGDTVLLYNQTGEIKANASIVDSCMPGVVFMHQGWWYKNGGSVNRITPGMVSDMGNQAVFNECRCAIKRIG